MYHNLQTTSDIQRFFQSLKLVTLLYIKKKKNPPIKKYRTVDDNFQFPAFILVLNLQSPVYFKAKRLFMCALSTISQHN